MSQISEERLNTYKEMCSTEERFEFYVKNEFTPILDVGNEISDKCEAFHDAVQALINHQAEKKPEEMNEKEREIWFTRTLSNMIRINQMMGGVITEIDNMRKAL
ncbi:hypothetical protein P9E34_04105 [Schinkia azotoformans]|uniref:hypothetical protein n=1 Tax=Schinkia azotoformans TaxID=1454 RepID=UPI002DC04642|nr:hypothetical protein [Schinkia azotoformans]MEC1723929.1 hypothetical protein [Schinkia azotoformans]